jgi:hypothetical protein
MAALGMAVWQDMIRAERLEDRGSTGTSDCRTVLALRAGDLASAGPWRSSQVPTAFLCPWPGGERLRCRVPWGTCT